MGDGASETERVRRRVVVRGRVQGVFFRDTCRQVAERAGVAGEVRNRSDGAVEVLLEGDASAVDEVVSWCRGGPPQAEVSDVEVSAEDPADLTGFDVR